MCAAIKRSNDGRSIQLPKLTNPLELWSHNHKRNANESRIASDVDTPANISTRPTPLEPRISNLPRNEGAFIRKTSRPQEENERDASRLKRMKIENILISSNIENLKLHNGQEPLFQNHTCISSERVVSANPLGDKPRIRSPLKPPPRPTESMMKSIQVALELKEQQQSLIKGGSTRSQSRKSKETTKENPNVSGLMKTKSSTAALQTSLQHIKALYTALLAPQRCPMGCKAIDMLVWRELENLARRVENLEKKLETK
ncbi:uncharacterized protein VTP21DRAFT_4531 [Calcarisporiella thermophila]|uniref:uncharacterized protein n=1 Tax=Calcarisporiella thermophila TaxID=911321 RepID=UPI00374400EE